MIVFSWDDEGTHGYEEDRRYGMLGALGEMEQFFLSFKLTCRRILYFKADLGYLANNKNK